MKLIRLTALTSIVLAFAIAFVSCEKIAEEKKTTDYEKKGIILTGSNENPQNPSTALGSMDVTYSKETRILTWSVTWSGLTGPVTLMHIHGTAPKGYNASPVQNIITPSNGIATPNATLYPATGKFSGTMLVDGVIVKELDLLNGMYYMNIHTAAYGGGEIRAQIEFK
ncbi:MAG: CHRD domain-containing protein [Chitinophagaceae bacterium]|nr:CHRD domain-containing protein [Chitinophagaceae bacterium]